MQIKISPKYGANPALSYCFWCGKEKNEVLLMGRIGRDDQKAPEGIVRDYMPCEDCLKIIANGIQVVSAVEVQPEDGRPPISPATDAHPTLYPLQMFTVMTKGGFRRMLQNLLRDKDDVEEIYQESVKVHTSILPAHIVKMYLEQYETRFGKIPDHI